MGEGWFRWRIRKQIPELNSSTLLDIKTRSDRAFAVHYRKYIEKYHNDKVKEFLTFILQRYEKDGVKEMGSDKLSSLIKLSGMDMRELKEACFRWCKYS